MREVVERGCPVDAADIVGYTALSHCCLQYPQPQLAETLLSLGANIDNRTIFGTTPVTEVLRATREMNVGRSFQSTFCTGHHHRKTGIGRSPATTWLDTRQTYRFVFLCCGSFILLGCRSRP